MRRRLVTQEGLPCRSLLEAKIDAVFHWKGTAHEHEVNVPGLPYRADFKMADGSYVEVAGMMNFQRYHQKLDKKMGDYQKHGITVRYLFDSDVHRMWEGCPLPIIAVERKCLDCGLVTIDLSSGRCRPCSRRKWGIDNATEEICTQCQKTWLRKGGSENAKFCSRRCYWKSLEHPWPSWEELDKELTTKSVAQVARDLGVKANALHQRLYRRQRRSA